MGLNHLSYQIQIDQAKKIAKDLYPIDGKAIVLLGELDFNYFLNRLKLNNFRYRLTYLIEIKKAPKNIFRA